MPGVKVAEKRVKKPVHPLCAALSFLISTHNRPDTALNPEANHKTLTTQFYTYFKRFSSSANLLTRISHQADLLNWEMIGIQYAKPHGDELIICPIRIFEQAGCAS
jgi:hypothetical protein